MNIFLPYFMLLVEVLDYVSSSEHLPCSRARSHCLHRHTCREALITFTAECSSLATGDSGECTLGCRNALVSLLSSDAGDELFNCDCQENGVCLEIKERMEICREDVARVLNPNSTISCSVAELICLGDSSCSVALQYYQRFCRKMFEGKSCTFQCKNSLDILLRQEGAVKLRSCYCDGREAYACSTVQKNMAALCFSSPNKVFNPPEELTHLIPLENEAADDEENEFIQLEREEFKARPKYTHISAHHRPLPMSSSGQPVLFNAVLLILLHLPLFSPL